MMEREELLRAKPILFNTEMACAILEGRKTQTRRVVKVRKNESIERILSSPYHKEHPEVSDCELLEALCFPAYSVGDIVYVRETWSFIPCIECAQSSPDKCGGMPVDYEDRDTASEGCYIYRADYSDPSRIGWRPSIHMPKKAARIFLRVTGVRVERLQDITLQDIYAEGVVASCGPLWANGADATDRGEESDTVCMGAPSVFTCGESTSLPEGGLIEPERSPHSPSATAPPSPAGEGSEKMTELKQMRWEFMNVWDDTVPAEKLSQHGWDANPFVWVYQFEEVK